MRVQGEELVIDEGEAAIEPEAPRPKAPLPQPSTVPGASLKFLV